MAKCSKLLIFLLSFSLASFGAKLTIYYPTTISPKTIEKSFKPLKLDTIAFAKYRDFKNNLKNRPDFVLSHEILGVSDKSYRESKTLTLNGESQFKYLLLSLDSKWTKDNLKNAKIGFVQIGNKRKMKKYFSRVIGTKFKRLKTVSKPEDLFPLLVFKSVDVIVVSPENYKDLKGKFSAKTFLVTKSSYVSYPKLFIKSDVKEKIDIRKIDFKSIGFGGVK